MKQHVTRNIATTSRVALAVTLSLASAIALGIGVNQLATVLKPHQKYMLFGLAASATTLTGSLLLAAASAMQLQEFSQQKAEDSRRVHFQPTSMGGKWVLIQQSNIHWGNIDFVASNRVSDKFDPDLN